MADHYHLWLGYRETGKKRRARREREWARDGGGDFPAAVPSRPTRAEGEAPRGRGVRQYTTGRLLRFTTRQRAHKYRQERFPDVRYYFVQQCGFAIEDCPSPDPIQAGERPPGVHTEST